MSWFKYIKEGEQDFKYPYVRRYISNFVPFDDLDEGSWLFCDLEDININKYYDGTLSDGQFNIVEDNDSYIVLYELLDQVDSDRIEDYRIVSSLVYDNKLFFQTAIPHSSNELIPNRYILYYKTPGIKTHINDTVVDFSEIDLYNYRVEPTDNKSYSFSFVNSSINWDSGKTFDPYAKVYGKFAGPNFRIYGSKGPDGGKFRIRFTILDELSGIEELIDLDWVNVDTYSSVEEENVILFQKEDFFLRDYSFEIETLYNVNELSSGKKIQINYYEFTYNQFLKLEAEQINPLVHSYAQVKGNI